MIIVCVYTYIYTYKKKNIYIHIYNAHKNHSDNTSHIRTPPQPAAAEITTNEADKGFTKRPRYQHIVFFSS